MKVKGSYLLDAKYKVITLVKSTFHETMGWRMYLECPINTNQKIPDWLLQVTKLKVTNTLGKRLTLKSTYVLCLVDLSTNDIILSLLFIITLVYLFLSLVNVVMF